MGGVSGNEGPPLAIGVGDCDAQFPESDVVEFDREFKPGGALKQATKIIILGSGVPGHRRMEEPASAQVDSSEKTPGAFEVGTESAIDCSLGKMLQPLMELARPKYEQSHLLIEVRAIPLDAGLLTNRRARAVAPDDILCFKYLTSGAVLLCDRDTNALLILLNCLCRPTGNAGDVREIGHPSAKNLFGQILWQAFVGLEEVVSI